MAVDLKRMGERIQARRKRLGLSQRALANRIKVTHATISAVEKGDYGTSVATVAEIAIQLSLSLDEILGLPAARREFAGEAVGTYLVQIAERERVADALDRTAKQMTGLAKRVRRALK